MEPFFIFVLVALGGFFILFLIGAGVIVGMYAKPEGTRSAMTTRIIDYSPKEHGGDTTLFLLKYHPKTRHYASPVNDTPTSHGLARIVIKEGLFGMRSRERTIEASRLQLPKDLKNGFGTYCADLLHVETQEQLDRLQHENSDLTLKLSEAERNYEQLARNQQEDKQRDKDQFVKDLQKLNPALQPRRTSGSAR